MNGNRTIRQYTARHLAGILVAFAAMGTLALPSGVGHAAGGPSAAVINFEMPEGLSPETLKLLRRANDILVRSCPGLAEYAPTIVQAKVLVAAYPKSILPGQEHWVRYGWDREVIYRIRLDSKHMLRYFLGAGKKPGIIATTAPSKFFCGLDDNNAIPVHFEMPDLAFLQNLPGG